MSTFLKANLAAIENLNQRGGRMLSIIDLIQRETVPIDLATYLICAMKENASILIGSEPGGAGKTTVMGALLGILPHDNQIITIPDAYYVHNIPKSFSDGCRTLIVHEIGTGTYFSYLSGHPIRELLMLVDKHTRFISNLHPDTIEKIESMFKSFGIDENLFSKINLVILLEYNKRTSNRWIREVWESKKPNSKHKLIYRKDGGFQSNFSDLYFYNHNIFDEIHSKIQYLIDNLITQLEDVANFMK